MALFRKTRQSSIECFLCQVTRQGHSRGLCNAQRIAWKVVKSTRLGASSNRLIISSSPLQTQREREHKRITFSLPHSPAAPRPALDTFNALEDHPEHAGRTQHDFFNHEHLDHRISHGNVPSDHHFGHCGLPGIRPVLQHVFERNLSQHGRHRSIRNRSRGSLPNRHACGFTIFRSIPQRFLKLDLSLHDWHRTWCSLADWHFDDRPLESHHFRQW